MKMTASVERPLSVDITVTATMTVGEWRQITDALKSENWNERWSAAKFCELLREQLRKVEYSALGFAESGPE